MNVKPLLLLIAALLAFPGIAAADTICWTGETSADPGDGIDPGWLEAKVEWEYQANVGDTGGVLSIEVYNLSNDGFDGFTLSELQFDTTGVAAITMDALPGFPQSDFDVDNNPGPGGGRYDWRLDFDQTGNDGILSTYGSPLATTITFEVTGNALSEANFFTGKAPVIKFTRGGSDAQDLSTWAYPKDCAMVPEPASFALMGVGIAGLVSRSALRRRKGA